MLVFLRSSVGIFHISIHKRMDQLARESTEQLTTRNGGLVRGNALFAPAGPISESGLNARDIRKRLECSRALLPNTAKIIMLTHPINRKRPIIGMREISFSDFPFIFVVARADLTRPGTTLPTPPSASLSHLSACGNHELLAIEKTTGIDISPQIVACK